MGLLDRMRSRAIAPGGSELSRTASAARIRLDDRTELERMRRRMERWQPMSWDFYDLVGEVKYGINKLADAASKVRLTPALQDDPEEDPIPLADFLRPGADDPGLTDVEIAAAFDVVRRLAYPVGHSENMRRMTVNFSVPGECYLLGLAARGEREERWEVRSTEDIVAAPSGGAALIDGPDVRDWIPIAPSDYLVRLWVPHPRKAWRPDSGLRGVLSVCEELLILDRTSRAVGRSRNNAGILTMPTELGLGPADPTSDNDEDEDPFFDDLMESLTTPVMEEGSASAVMPHLIYGKAEYLHPDALRHIDLARGIDERHDQRTERLLRRLANGINMPAEVILGMSDVNHWTAWQIEESTFKAHVEPVVILGCTSLTSGYFRPMFSKYEGVRPEIAQRLVVWYDASKLVARPNRASDAKDLSALGAISNRALRDAADFDDEDAPTPEELEEMLAWRRSGRPSISTGGEGNEAPNERPQPKDAGPPTQEDPPNEDDAPGQTASAQTQELRTEPLVAALSPSFEGEADGVILALMPTPEEAAAIAREGGDPPERLHVTLAFLGSVADLSDADRQSISAAAEAAARTSSSLAGVVSGIGHFDTAERDDGLIPCVGLIDAPGIGGLRSRAMGALAEQGISSPSEHDFMPHLTLGYHEWDEHDYAVGTQDTVAGQAVSFSELIVRFGEEEQRYPLSGDSITAAASRPRRSAASRIGDRQMEIDRGIKERLSGAFDQSMRRAMERAGGRLITKVKASKDARLKELVAGSPKLEVVSKLGPHLISSLGLSPESLLEGAFLELAPRFDRWIEQGQEQALNLIPNLSRGEGAIAEATFRTDRAEAWAWTLGELQRLGTERLYEPDPREPERGEFDGSILVPYGVARGALARAGGASHEPIARVAAGGADILRFVLGMATGWFIRGQLHAHQIITRGYIWDYGAFARTRPFEPHLDLDGIEFSNFDDPLLSNRDSFPPEPFYLPGDHDGCGCDFHPQTDEM